MAIDLDDDGVKVGPWQVLSAVVAIEGWRAVWFVDPDQPVARLIVMWASCDRKSVWKAGELGIHTKMMRYRHEHRYLPMVLFGGEIVVVDDADAIIPPSQDYIWLQGQIASDCALHDPRPRST